MALGMTLIVAAITAAGLADKTPNSALSLLFFVPVVFVSTRYPLRTVLAVGAGCLWCFLAVALHGGRSPGWVFTFAAVLGCTALTAARQARNHDRVRDELTRASQTDPLTGCLNRRGFEERAGDALRCAAAAGRPVGVIVLDLDGFK